MKILFHEQRRLLDSQMVGIHSSSKTLLGSLHPMVQQLWLQRRAAQLYCEEAHILSCMTFQKCIAYMHMQLIFLARSGYIGLLMSRNVVFYSLGITSKVGFSRKCLSSEWGTEGSPLAQEERSWHWLLRALLGLQSSSLSRAHPVRGYPNKK